jgi:hypothetical protein
MILLQPTQLRFNYHPSKVPSDAHTRADGLSCMTPQQPAPQNNRTPTLSIFTLKPPAFTAFSGNILVMAPGLTIGVFESDTYSLLHKGFANEDTWRCFFFWRMTARDSEDEEIFGTSIFFSFLFTRLRDQS